VEDRLSPASEDRFSRIFIDLSEENDEGLEVDESRNIAFVPRIQLYSAPTPQHGSFQSASSTNSNFHRQKLVNSGVKELNICHHNGIQIKKDDTVETTNGDFIRVKRITKDSFGILRIRGLRFRRAKEFPVADRQLNEVVLWLERRAEDSCLQSERGLYEIEVAKVIQKRTLTMTGDMFPLHSWRLDGEFAPLFSRRRLTQDEKDQIRENASLTCRYVFIPVYQKSRRESDPHIKANEGQIRRVTEEESDIYKGIPFDPDFFPVIDYHELKDGSITYASAFCGSGGDVRGARLAGLKVVFTFDKCKDAIETCRANNPDIAEHIHELEHEDFLNSPPGAIPRTIILHISFPCQPFSKANTCGLYTADWDKNSALLLSVGDYLRKIRPMILTLENTAGLHERWPEYFSHVISECVKMGYNVRWKISNLQEYGLPALRTRFLLIAARYDVPLSEFPDASFRRPNNTTQNLPIYRTIGDYLGDCDYTKPEYEILKTTKWTPDKWKPPYNPYETYATCLMTNGSAVPHWSGKRPFIWPELARLQQFPENYVFLGNTTSIKRQIGNAVPPIVWKKIIRKIIQTLRIFATDEMDESNNECTNLHDPRLSVGSRSSTRTLEDLPAMIEISQHDPQSPTSVAIDTMFTLSNPQEPTRSTQAFKSLPEKRSFIDLTRKLDDDPSPSGKRRTRNEDRFIAAMKRRKLATVIDLTKD
jgi:DNA (cytosine-5)-methyltransferase 1